MSNSILLLIQVLCKVVQTTFISSSRISVRQSYGSVPAREILTSWLPSRLCSRISLSSPSIVLTHEGRIISRVNSAGGKPSGITESRYEPGKTDSIDSPLFNRFLKSLSCNTSTYSSKSPSSKLFFKMSIRLMENG